MLIQNLFLNIQRNNRKKLKPRININERFGENFFNKIWWIWLLSD